LLRPYPIIAKVGTHAYGVETLIREHGLALALAATGASIPQPFPGTAPIHHSETGFIVTLWNRLDHDPNAEVDGPSVGRSLAKIHDALRIAAWNFQAFGPAWNMPGEHCSMT
jgi:hypothetical protein